MAPIAKQYPAAPLYHKVKGAATPVLIGKNLGKPTDLPHAGSVLAPSVFIPAQGSQIRKEYQTLRIVAAVTCPARIAMSHLASHMPSTAHSSLYNKCRTTTPQPAIYL